MRERSGPQKMLDAIFVVGCLLGFAALVKAALGLN